MEWDPERDPGWDPEEVVDADPVVRRVRDVGAAVAGQRDRPPNASVPNAVPRSRTGPVRPAPPCPVPSADQP
jgi:hypothetical protein